jgi:O-methyltransferase
MRFLARLSRLGLATARDQGPDVGSSVTGLSLAASPEQPDPEQSGTQERDRLDPGRALPTRLMMFPPYDRGLETYISSDDPVRFASVLIALDTIQKEGVPGSCAELGVYRGDMSVVIRAACPQRSLYLFDTFEGFPAADLQVPDERFRDTSVDLVLERLGDPTRVIVRKGYFPETARGLEEETFAFVMLDADLYAPTVAGLQFFYPRLAPRGFIFAHDYNSPESDWAVSRAVNEFLADKPERPIAIPDKWGSVIIRKV